MRLWKSLKFNDEKILSGYDASEWQIGEWRTVPAPEKSCVGLNCCPYIADAMGYVSMQVLAEVEVSGKKITDDDKITAEKMRIIHAWKWEKKDSVALAIFAAECVIENFERQYPDDKRPREAIEAAKAWLINPCEETQSAAWSAAESAWSAWSAAESAAESAWSAWSAAESAAESAWSAAESAWSAAESAWSVSDIQKEKEKMKKKIQRWIIKHLSELEEL